jgi:hypothetical protein
MTKSNAKAILACRKAILKALDDCAERLHEPDRTQFDAYWGAHIRSTMEGYGYGSAPIALATETLKRKVAGERR